MIAEYDELTGLATKDFFYENVEAAIKMNNSEQHNLLYLNIDNFKIFNDLYGRKKGDDVLKQIGSLLLFLAKNKNLCARIHSDWFAFYLTGSDLSDIDLKNISEIINNQFKEETMPIVIHFGIYQFTEQTESISTLAGRAKRALKSIKGDSVNTIAYYDKEFMEEEKKDHHITKCFDSALKNGEFKIFLQPQVSSENKLKGAEVLARWVNEQNTVISPGYFIKTLEKTGLISKLDNNIWEQAANLLKSWKETDKDDLYLSINISVKDFTNLNVYSTLTDIVKKYDIPPQKLRLEITESVLMSNAKQILEITEKLRKDGFYIEVDDFGKGYSSLSMLKDIDVDMIKIDMDFLKHTENESKSAIILESIIGMSKRLGIEVLIEGVETEAQKDFLKMLGCDMYQGYYFSKPIPLADFNKKYFNSYGEKNAI